MNSIFLSAQNVGFTSRLGLNINSLEKDNIQGKSFGTGVNVGGITTIHLNEKFSIGTGLYFSKKQKNYFITEKQSLLSSLNTGFLRGAINDTLVTQIKSFVNDTVYSYTRGKVALNYFEIPLMCVYHIKSFDVAAGGYFSYLYSAKSKEELTQESSLLDIVYPLLDSIPFIGSIAKPIINSTYPGYLKPLVTESSDKGKYNSYDAGMVLDVTYNMENNFNINVRFVQGFVNYRKTPLNKKDYNRTFMISLGYTLGAKAGAKKAKKIYDLHEKPVEEKKL